MSLRRAVPVDGGDAGRLGGGTAAGSGRVGMGQGSIAGERGSAASASATTKGMAASMRRLMGAGGDDDDGGGRFEESRGADLPLWATKWNGWVRPRQAGEHLIHASGQALSPAPWGLGPLGPGGCLRRSLRVGRGQRGAASFPGGIDALIGNGCIMYEQLTPRFP